MIYRRLYTFYSKTPINDLRDKIKGEHLKIHDLDFEIVEKEGILKIIPHTEYADDKIYTLPITHIIFSKDKKGTKVRMSSKPRRIDIGGPSLALAFSVFIFLAGICMNIFLDESYSLASVIVMVLGGGILLLFTIKMYTGYFDYIRQQKKWLKSHL